MNLRHGLSAARTSAASRRISTRSKLLTYPRTDCRLPVARHGRLRSRTTLRKLRHCELGARAVSRPSTSAIRSDLERGPRCKPKRVFDDSKVTDHHAIVPTDAGGGSGETSIGEHEVRLRRGCDGGSCRPSSATDLQDVSTVHDEVLGRAVDLDFRARGVVIDRAGLERARAQDRREGQEVEGQGQGAGWRRTTPTSQELPPFEQRRDRGRTSPRDPRGARPSRRGPTRRTRCSPRWRPRAS